MSNNKPVQEFRVGLVKAAIWEKKTEKGSFHSVTLSRLYKGENGWKQSHSFSDRELDSIVEVIGQAKAWIGEQSSNR